MDMHELKFSDNSFDAVYSAFVITYSDDIPKAVAETIRVAKDGALVVFVYEHLALGAGNRFGKNNRSEEHTSELQSPCNLVCRLLLENKNTSLAALSVLIALPRHSVSSRKRQPVPSMSSLPRHLGRPRPIARFLASYRIMSVPDSTPP